MSLQYDQYLAEHAANIRKGFQWIQENVPELLEGDVDLERQICQEHDGSKILPDEYPAYDAFFYGGEVTPAVKEARDRAWALHIQRNPHHWQHWEEEGVAGEMPPRYVLEMICDWWTFSWAKGNLHEIFSWYGERNGRMNLHPATRALAESILDQIQERLAASAKD